MFAITAWIGLSATASAEVERYYAKMTNRGENMTGFFMKLEQGGCFVKAFGQDCDTLIAAGQGARFKAYLNIQPAPGKRNPYRNVSQVQLLEKVVQF